MNKFTALALAFLTGSAAAQTPATNPMPDGSRDMYVGLGLVSAARYDGAEHSERKALPVLQVQWSNGVFVSGMNAGMHLSRDPRVEFGPLLELQRRRDESGRGGGVDGILMRYSVVSLPDAELSENRLNGMTPVATRLLGGGFLNAYLTPDWRVTGSLLYGAGNERDGARLDLGVQRLAMQAGAHHRISVAAGVSLVNAGYNRAFFGVSEFDSLRSGNPVYRPGGGLKDAHLGLRWNWAFTPSWMLTSNVQLMRLNGDARHSPLVERPTNLTVSTAFAYRF
ncbi:MipA/OmpV family protein [Massilia brevitalea]|uniref:MipA/OmpV family protein n=1 Tax=Massilia brevitalea TaxID=442526 RepID=UPI0027393593|nr:MipA/OmpV family protein [Massilia brevitalea]